MTIEKTDGHDGLKQKAKLPSIRDLTQQEETAILRRMLKAYLVSGTEDIPSSDLITKYRDELNRLCSIDKDTQDVFGHINTWWVFGDVIAKFSDTILLAEVENIGYKRSKRGEKQMPNELYRTKNETIIVDDGVSTTVLDEMRKIAWD